MVRQGLLSSVLVGLAALALCVGSALAEGDAPAPVKKDAAKTDTAKKETSTKSSTPVEIRPSDKKPESGPVEKARRQLQADQTALANAKAAHNLVATRLLGQFEGTDEMKAAVADENKAQDAYQAAIDAVIARLSTQDDYKVAVAARDAARAKVEEVKRSNPSIDQRVAVANEAAAASAVVSRMEGAAEEADPAYKTAQSTLMEAHKKVVALREQYAKSLQSNEEWTKAGQAVQEAQSKVVDDQKELNEAQRTYNIQKASYALYLQKKQEEEAKKRLLYTGKYYVRPDGKAVPLPTPTPRIDGGAPKPMTNGG
ncbi:MAG: hypothetical protein BIFFINMI_03966 [Phycisphaerae bacterium]|nr:hypothetical protein [Phycisphaerae bacterium]